MQQIMAVGNLLQDAATVQGHNGGDPFISFKIVCNEKKGDMDTKTIYEATYRSSGVLDYLKKGKKVLLVGSPSVRAYMSKDNVPVGQIVIRVHSLELL